MIISIIFKDKSSKRFYNIKDFYTNETVLNFSCIEGFFNDRVSFHFDLSEVEKFNLYYEYKKD